MKGRIPFLAASSLIIGCTNSTQPPDAAREGVTLTAASPTILVVPAGDYAKDIPTVVAYDEKGTPVPHAVVTFSMEGPIDASIEHSVDTTNSEGVARMGLWRVGERAGEKNIVTARLVSGASVSFVANVVPRAAARIVKLEGDNQVVRSGTPVAVNPSVRVTDVYNNPVPGQPVNFHVLSGGGSVATTEATTDSLGTVAALGWVTGAPGEQLLSVAAAGVNQAFRAIAVNSPTTCADPNELIVPSSLNREMTSANCIEAEKPFTIYYFSVPVASEASFEMSSSAFDTYLEVRDANFKLIASNDNVDGTRNSRIRAMLPPGVYQLVAMDKTPGAYGPFNVFVRNQPSASAGCDGLYVTHGASRRSFLQSLTCDGISLGYSDLYRMHLEPGESVNVQVLDRSYSGAHAVIMDESGNTLPVDNLETNTFDYNGRFTATRSIDIIVRIFATEDWAEYSANFN